MLDGKGDLKDDGGGRLGADGTVNGLGLCDIVVAAADERDDDALEEVDAVRFEEDDELDGRVRGWNHVVGRFKPLGLGTLNPVDPLSNFAPDILILSSVATLRIPAMCPAIDVSMLTKRLALVSVHKADRICQQT